MKIKYKILIVVGLVLLTQHNILYSQNMSTTPTFGLKGGLLLSTVTGDEAIDPHSKKIGPLIGVTGSYYVHPKLSIRCELNYESKGGKFSIHEMNMNLNYISLPLYLKFNFTKDPEFYVYGGAYGAYLLSAKTKGTYEIVLGNDYISESINEDIMDNITRFDIGLIGGIGVQGRYNRWADIFLDIRYTYGFVNLDNDNAEFRYNFNFTEFWPEQDVGKPKNKALMITTGFIIYLDPR